MGDVTQFTHNPISAARPPSDVPGLVMTNPPYGTRIGNKKPLFGLYASFGEQMKTHFKGWRVGLVTSDADLVKVTKLPFTPAGPVVDHGGLKVRLWLTEALS